MQYNYLKALDDKDCIYVRLFAMDFSKAFDNVKHSLVGEKLKALPLNPYVVNWYLSFLMDISQEVINQFFSWTQDNAMSCNLKKCNELKLCKKVAHDIDPVNSITQVSSLTVLGVTLQSNHRFNEHIKAKLQEANKCLYVIRCLRKEEYQQPDIDYFFRLIVLTKLTYGLPIYASSTPDLTAVQNFLQCCYRRKYISYQINIYDVLEKADRALFNKISSMPGHPLYPYLPKTNESSARLRVRCSQLPRVNTQRFKNSFINRLHFILKEAI